MSKPSAGGGVIGSGRRGARRRRKESVHRLADIHVPPEIQRRDLVHPRRALAARVRNLVYPGLAQVAVEPGQRLGVVDLHAVSAQVLQAQHILRTRFLLQQHERFLIQIHEAWTNLFLRADDNDGRIADGNSFAVDSAADGDGDGLPDAWELTYFGTLGDGPGGDPDGDGVTNLQEYLAGTDPNDPTSKLAITDYTTTPGGITATSLSVTGTVLLDFSKSPLADGTYTVITYGSTTGGGRSGRLGRSGLG